MIEFLRGLRLSPCVGWEYSRDRRALASCWRNRSDINAALPGRIILISVKSPGWVWIYIRSQGK
jgi:hypothetical protein